MAMPMSKAIWCLPARCKIRARSQTVTRETNSITSGAGKFCCSFQKASGKRIHLFLFQPIHPHLVNTVEVKAFKYLNILTACSADNVGSLPL